MHWHKVPDSNHRYLLPLPPAGTELDKTDLLYRCAPFGSTFSNPDSYVMQPYEVHVSFKRSLLVLALGLIQILTVLEGQGQCYLLPPQQIMGFVTQRTSKVYNFRLDATAESPDSTRPGVKTRTEIVYYAARPDFLRQEITSEAGSSTVLAGSGRRLSVLDGYLLEEATRHEEIFPILLFAKSTTALRRLLVDEQVDVNQVHLSRMGDQIAYVIGGPPGEPETPQFWCDKDRFWPLRLVGRRSQVGVVNLVDIRFLSYRQVAKDIWLPSIIEFYRNSQLFLRLVIEKTHHNQMFPQSLFDLRAFTAKYPPLPPSEMPSKQSPETLEQMRRYLEKKYE
jgi:hypothetical protein